MKFHKDGTSDPLAIFVFGSNMAGRHGAGAALAAKQHFGAETGVGIGRTGLAYAIPTLDAYFQQLPLEGIAASVRSFLDYAQEHPELEFCVTRIGCVLANRTNADIAPMFKGAPDNCSFAHEWEEFLS